MRVLADVQVLARADVLHDPAGALLLELPLCADEAGLADMQDIGRTRPHLLVVSAVVVEADERGVVAAGEVDAVSCLAVHELVHAA